MPVRLQCPQCQSEDTWATYIHQPCPNAPTGRTEWEIEAMGATPDSKPQPAPCPAPLDGKLVPADHVTCRTCGHTW
jgi:hypothetical protein